jgi:hypothetical protein
MLRITVHDGPEALTFQLEGKLIGAWAQELERSWNTRVSLREHGKALIVDLTETLYIDEEGKRILTTLFREGAFFRTAGTMTSSVVEEITGKSPKPWRGILTQSIVLLMAVSVMRSAADPPASPPMLRLTLRDAIQLYAK